MAQERCKWRLKWSCELGRGERGVGPGRKRGNVMLQGKTKWAQNALVAGLTQGAGRRYEKSMEKDWIFRSFQSLMNELV